MTQDANLSQQLQSLRQEHYTLVMGLSTAARVQDKEGVKHFQDSLQKLWQKWDAIINKVVDLETTAYNTKAVLAICIGGDDDA